MDRFVNKKIEKQTIYEIYRACRLCGAGGGYKMPIIQNVVNLDNCDVELKQKIRECVQIQVHQEDKMPPLICELCVDKVNDFYEFLEMCRQTNKRTRLRLGLPPQAMPRGAPDAGDCILGVTEPIYPQDDDWDEPLAPRGRRPGTHVKAEEPPREPREPRGPRASRQRGPSPPPAPRAPSRLQSKVKKCTSPPPKSILKKGTSKKPDASPPPSARLKRAREPDAKPDAKPDAPAKRVKISLKSLPSKSSKQTSRSTRQKEEAERQKARQREAKQREAKRREAKQKEREARESQAACSVCGGVFRSSQALTSHRRCHVVTYTNPKLACNPCELWFSSAAQAEAHRARHRRGLRYRCRRCALATDTLAAYDKHIAERRCVLWAEVPDVRCAACGRAFPTWSLLDAHRCAGPAARPAKCDKCGKEYATRKSLANHARACKRGVSVPAELRARLRPLQVRVARCDPLLGGAARCDVSGLRSIYGLDKNCVYPYLVSGARIKSELSDCMVKINDLDFGGYVHWDSEHSGDSDDGLDGLEPARSRTVESLAACALKTIFSTKCLGKVPRKFRRLKMEPVIDSLCERLDDNIEKDCTDKDVPASDKVDDKKVDDDDDLFPKENNAGKVTNDDFDSLFSDKKTVCDGVDKIAAVTHKLGSLHMNSESDNVTDSMDSGVKGLDKDNIHNVSDSSKVLSGSTSEIKSNIDEENDLENVQSQSQSDETDNVEQNVCLETDVKEKGINEDQKTGSAEPTVEILNHVESINRMTDANNEEDISKSEESFEKIDSDQNNTGNINEPEDNETLHNDKGSISTQSEISTGNNDTLNSGNKEDDDEKLEKTEKVNTDVESKLNPAVDDKEIHNEDRTVKVVKENHVDCDKNQANGDTEIDDMALNMNDLEDYSDGEFDDCDLMAEIDAQIGEKKDEKTELKADIEKEGGVKETAVEDVEKENNVEIKQDKIQLGDVVPKEDHKSMDLDSISDDEFDFND